MCKGTLRVLPVIIYNNIMGFSAIKPEGDFPVIVPNIFIKKSTVAHRMRGLSTFSEEAKSLKVKKKLMIIKNILV